MKKDKPTQAPVWWKNTFFWLAGILASLGLFALVAGEATIRDPGQIRESGLVWIYFGSAAVMFVNGWLTHQQAERHHQETHGDL